MMSSAQQSRHYHHGRSPAAWTGSVMAAVGFVLATVAAMLGPNWILVGIAVAIIAIAGIVTLVMKKMGLGNG